MIARTAHLVCGAMLLFSVVPASGIAQRRPDRPVRPFAGRRQGGPKRPLPELLQRVVRAAITLRLSGERVVDQRVQGQLVRHEENVLRVGLRTRIWFPAGSRFAGQIIVDNGTFRWRYNPRNKVLNQEPSQRDDTIARLVGPKNNMLAPRVQLLAGGPVAGVDTTLARILNRQGSTVQELYIDPSTGAVLKRVGYNGQGEVVANYEFTSVNYNPSYSPSDFEPPKSPWPAVTPETNLRRLASNNGLPAPMIRSGQGFELFNSNVNSRALVRVLHEVYLGPRGRLSVFIFRAHIDPSRLMPRPGRQNNAYSTTVDDATVVLVGPYSPDELQRLAATMSRL